MLVAWETTVWAVLQERPLSTFERNDLVSVKGESLLEPERARICG